MDVGSLTVVACDTDESVGEGGIDIWALSTAVSDGGKTCLPVGNDDSFGRLLLFNCDGLGTIEWDKLCGGGGRRSTLGSIGCC